MLELLYICDMVCKGKGERVWVKKYIIFSLGTYFIIWLYGKEQGTFHKIEQARARATMDSRMAVNRLIINFNELIWC